MSNQLYKAKGKKFNESIANQLKTARENNGYSIRGLAKEMDLNPTTIMRYESTEYNVSMEKMYEVSLILGLKPMDVLQEAYRYAETIQS